MVNTLFSVRNYLNYRFRAGTIHDVHSPFVFELLNNVIRDQTPYYGFEVIESLRAKHLLDNRVITIKDLGTGIDNRKEKISSIASRTVKPKKYAQLLFRLANRFQPENILEIGTSLGLTTLYLSLPKKNSKIITLEGCPEIADLARQNFSKLKRNNIELLEGEFSQTLKPALEKLKRLDLVYFDGNHRFDSTLSYFRECLKHAHENSLFVVDDIHWSREMNEAWKAIQDDHAVTLTIDLFQFGLVFFRKGFSRQHFVLKY